MKILEFVLICQIITFSYIDGEEFCQFETFSPQCQNDELLVINEASFGRMRFGRCITETQGIGLVNDPKYIGCFTDVTPFVAKKCSGKRECEIKIPDLKLVTDNVCYAELYMYLDVTYGCLKVAQDNRQCTITSVSDKEVHVFPAASKSSLCGSMDHPWKVEAYKGQRINISLLNYAPKSKLGQDSKVCLDKFVHSYIVDTGDKRRVPICANGRMDGSFFFASSSNAVKIVFDTKKSEDKLDGEYGILRLIATGCSDLIPPADAWLKRTENEATIGCYSTRLRWQLKCQGQRWVGVIGNCSYAMINNDKLNIHLVENHSEGGQNQVVAIAVICITGITLCTVISCFGIVCFKRYNAKSKLATKLFHQRQSTLRLQNGNLKNSQICQENGIPEAGKPGLPVYSDCDFGEDGKYQVGNNQYFVLDSEYEKKDLNN